MAQVVSGRILLVLAFSPGSGPALAGSYWLWQVFFPNFGCFWLAMVASGWLWLALAGSGWLLVALAESVWLLITLAGSSSLWWAFANSGLL